MKYVYLVFIKDEDERVTIAGAFTSQTRAWEERDNLMNDGHSVTSEKIPLNEEVYRLLNIWTHGERH
ncbi:hypothetical protein [Bacillus phage vB_BanS-Thrax1]|nr:hypothetical protein [Bacillus phage vB_BanS-Thrax1]